MEFNKEIHNHNTHHNSNLHIQFCKSIAFTLVLWAQDLSNIINPSNLKLEKKSDTERGR